MPTGEGRGTSRGKAGFRDDCHRPETREGVMCGVVGGPSTAHITTLSMVSEYGHIVGVSEGHVTSMSGRWEVCVGGGGGAIEGRDLGYVGLSK